MRRNSASTSFSRSLRSANVTFGLADFCPAPEEHNVSVSSTSETETLESEGDLYRRYIQPIQAGGYGIETRKLRAREPNIVVHLVVLLFPAEKEGRDLSTTMRRRHANVEAMRNIHVRQRLLFQPALVPEHMQSDTGDLSLRCDFISMLRNQTSLQF